jgi:fructoselysine 6-kinase
VAAAGGSSFGVLGDNTIDRYVGHEDALHVGGNALNVAVHLAHSGADVRYAGAVAGDELGRLVRRTLVAQGVGVDQLLTLPGRTSVSRIRVQPDGDRVFEHEDFGVCDDYAPRPEDLDALASCRTVHLGMLRRPAPVRQALRTRGVRVSQDCAVTPGYDGLDVAFCSAGERTDRARRTAEEAVAGGAGLAVVTCGAAGSLAHDGATWWEQPALPVVVVDTTGAGDSYIAGFLLALDGGQPVAEAMRAGASAAARTCGHLGAWQDSGRRPVRR